jgi:sugar/nucleoside kinase (ribokinase family)
VVDSFVGRLVDPIGAGDALLALATLSLVQSGSIVVASILGSLAAAAACEREGNVPVLIPEVEDKLDALKRAAGY